MRAVREVTGLCSLFGMDETDVQVALPGVGQGDRTCRKYREGDQMSIRPPTLREKRRYLLARIDPAGTAIETKDLYYAVYEAVVSLFGDMAAAAMQPSVLAIESGHAILRCRRGAEREFAIALSTLSCMPGLHPCCESARGVGDDREPAGADCNARAAGT